MAFLKGLENVVKNPKNGEYAGRIIMVLLVAMAYFHHLPKFYNCFLFLLLLNLKKWLMQEMEYHSKICELKPQKAMTSLLIAVAKGKTAAPGFEGGEIVESVGLLDYNEHENIDRSMPMGSSLSLTWLILRSCVEISGQIADMGGDYPNLLGFEKNHFDFDNDKGLGIDRNRSPSVVMLTQHSFCSHQHCVGASARSNPC